MADSEYGTNMLRIEKYVACKIELYFFLLIFCLNEFVHVCLEFMPKNAA